MENKSFEELINELEEIVKNLESNKLSLEESVKEYQKGIEISLECKKRLDEAKSVVVTKMTETGEKEFNQEDRLMPKYSEYAVELQKVVKSINNFL